MRTLAYCLTVGTLAALVAAGMLALRPEARSVPERPRSIRVCTVTALDAERQPVLKLCSDGHGLERTTGRWRDAGPVTPLPGVPAR